MKKKELFCSSGWCLLLLKIFSILCAEIQWPSCIYGIYLERRQHKTVAFSIFILNSGHMIFLLSSQTFWFYWTRIWNLSILHWKSKNKIIWANNWCALNKKKFLFVILVDFSHDFCCFHCNLDLDSICTWIWIQCVLFRNNIFYLGQLCTK